MKGRTAHQVESGDPEVGGGDEGQEGQPEEPGVQLRVPGNGGPQKG